MRQPGGQDRRDPETPSCASNSARTGTTVSAGGALNGPLGLVIAPNGDVLTVNVGDGNIVETTPAGAQIDPQVLDGTRTPAGAGTLLGLAVAPQGAGVCFADDGSNTLNCSTEPVGGVAGPAGHRTGRVRS
jgi:hypothetical protein